MNVNNLNVKEVGPSTLLRLHEVREQKTGVFAQLNSPDIRIIRDFDYTFILDIKNKTLCPWFVTNNDERYYRVNEEVQLDVRLKNKFDKDRQHHAYLTLSPKQATVLHRYLYFLANDLRCNYGEELTALI